MRAAIEKAGITTAKYEPQFRNIDRRNLDPSDLATDRAVVEQARQFERSTSESSPQQREGSARTAENWKLNSTNKSNTFVISERSTGPQQLMRILRKSANCSGSHRPAPAIDDRCAIGTQKLDDSYRMNRVWTRRMMQLAMHPDQRTAEYVTTCSVD